MSKNIHIFIQDDPSDRRRDGDVSVYRSGLRDPGRETTGSMPDDPGRETTQSEPDDPGRETTGSEPDDPGRETTGSEPDDPRGGFFAFPFPYTSGYACAPPCGCGEAKGRLGSPSRPELRPRDYSGFVIVRLAVGTDVASYESLDELARDVPLPGLLAALEVDSAEDDADADGGGDTTGDEGALTPPAADADADGDGVPDDEPDPLHDPLYVETSGGGYFADTALEVLVSRPLIEGWGCYTRELVVDAIRDAERRAQSSPLPPRHSLTSYWRVDVRPYPELADAVVERLNALPEVDLAYRELAVSDPEVSTTGGPGATFAEDQSYLDDAPVGIGARWAWERLPEGGPDVNVCDLEQRWHPEHRDLDQVSGVLFHGVNRDGADEEGGFGHHGTAVLGELAAAGLLAGGAQPVGRFSLSSHYLSRNSRLGGGPHPFAGTNGHVAAAVFYSLIDPNPANGLYPVRAGDVLLLEVQRALLPTEVDAADFDAIRLACALGVTVVEAAGNGGRNLDAYVDPDTGIGLRRGDPRFRDSGAILVGAARSSLPHNRASFSNHGSRVDCYAWGDSVTSCGYGDLSGTGTEDYYTNTFAGTSSAAPIIAVAAALVQRLHGQRGERLGPREMRDLLSDRATNTPQGPDVAGNVGVMPDLCALVRDVLQLVPDLYPRRHPCDDGSEPAADDEISSSPDVVVLPAGGSADGLGEGTAANDPAPGVAAKPKEGPYDVRVRLRNRGLCAGCAEVRLFASPAATLITPDFWQPVPTADGAALRVDDVPQGDVLTLSEPVPFEPGLPEAASNVGLLPPFAFLAVAEEVDCEDGGEDAHYPARVERCEGLPPGGRYFDWAAWRAFLRRPGVAWRNVHRERVHRGGQLDGTVDLPFLFAGTPDRARRFDLEVVRRLPKGAAVRVEVPRGLGAKLVQAQPLLRAEPVQGLDTHLRLTLPSRPRTPFPRVKLAAGVCAPATFQLSGLTDPGKGYSLALRQLWRGEEVGRITWYLD